MVQAFHAAGIGVLLDVVLNHTAEGGADGPVLNFKGLMPGEFYHRDGDEFRDYTGCGNTINTNHPVVTQMLVQDPAHLGRGAPRGRLPLRPGERVRPRQRRRARWSIRPAPGPSRRRCPARP